MGEQQSSSDRPAAHSSTPQRNIRLYDRGTRLELEFEPALGSAALVTLAFNEDAPFYYRGEAELVRGRLSFLSDGYLIDAIKHTSQASDDLIILHVIIELEDETITLAVELQGGKFRL